MDPLTERIDQLTPLQRAAYALKEMQGKLDAYEQARSEPIAIVGMACRFPGGADSPRAFWKLLCAGVDAIREVPDDRWDADTFYDPAPGTPGKTNTRWGGFLDQVDGFDADFFGISPREVVKMDPQQRLLLEMAWEALEDAGLPPARLPAARTGVYVGIIGSDYVHILSKDITNFDAYAGTGNSHCIASNRLSYLLDLHGPSLSLDTACSSSLVGVHLACQSLRSGELDLALAGGVNLMLCPDTTIALSQAWMLSSSGRCKTFDAAADGYVRSEGGGVVVLKRLGDALADGDPIWAVIRGTAVNQDGRSNGLTAPSGPAQEAVIAAALADAGLEPSQVDYVEAHGTGTPLGDPIEVQALLSVMSRGRSPDRPLMIGSVKTNIGHLEAGAGIAGLMKAVLALRFEKIPPHLHLEAVNPLLAPEGPPFEIPTTLRDWPRSATPRRAGLSSFGFGGTNAHAVLEEPPAGSPDPGGLDRPRHVLTLSARNAAALSDLVGRYREWLRDNPAISLADLAHSASTGRTHFEHRVAVVAGSTAELGEHLQAHATGRSPAAVKTGPGAASGKGGVPIAFLFTGQGAQYAGMGRALFESQPTFRNALLRCDEILRGDLPRPLCSVLYPGPGVTTPIDQTEYTQPALFSLGYALSELWRSWGVEPRAVLGHSVGEYVAACVAGVMSLEDGLRLIAERARQMQSLPAGGAMAAVRGPEATVIEALEPFEGRVAVAALNGPDNVVISGPEGDLETVLASLAAAGIASQRLTTSHAFHSPLLEPMLDRLEAAAGSVRFAPPRIAVVSNLTGLAVENGTLAEPGYWRRHARQPVLFARGIRTLAEQGYGVFVEIGPSPVLLGMGRRCLPDGAGVWLPSLRKGRDDWQTLLESLATLYTRGLDVDWSGFDRDYHPRRRVPLPAYPFQRRRFWLGDARESRPESAAARPPEESGASHPLLGRRVPLPVAEVVFESFLQAGRPALLGDHRVLGETILSGTAFGEMALAAAEAIGQGPWVVEDVSFQAPLVLSPTQPRRVQTILEPEGRGRAGFRIASLGEGQEAGWTTHAAGRVRAVSDAAAGHDGRAVNADEIRASFAGDPFGHEDRTQCLLMGGLEPGPSYTWIEQHWEEEGQRLGRLRGPRDADRAEAFRVHPGLLDCGIQLLGATLPGAGKTARCYIPISVQRIRVHGPVDGESWCHARLGSFARDTGTGDFRIYDDSGRLRVEVEGLRIELVDHDWLRRALGRSEPDWVYELRWKAKPAEPREPGGESEPPGLWLVVGGSPDLRDSLARGLAALGQHCLTREPEVPLEELRRTLAEAAASAAPPLRGVVYASSLGVDPPADDDAGPGALALARERCCGGVLDLLHSLEEAGLKRPPRVWLLTRAAQAVGDPSPVNVAQAPLWGLGRVIAVEHPELASVLLDLDPAAPTVQADADAILDEVLRGDREDQVAHRGGVRHVARLVRAGDRESASLAVPKGLPFHLEFTNRGELGSLMLRPVMRRPPGPHQVEIRVRATGLNFRDVMNVLGLYPGDAGPLGGECAGEIAAVGAGVEGFAVGDPVVALAPGSFSSYALTPASFVVPKPAHLDFAQAAAIPIAFVTAHLALVELAEIAAGDRVLIHAASGGVGLAALQLARTAGAEVYATAGSPEKREWLRSLGVEHVFDSRSLEFADRIGDQLGGAGLRVVLNSLTGESIPRGLALLAPGGHFLELGKTDLLDQEQVDERWPGVSYRTIALDRMMVEEPETVGRLLRTVMAGFELGSLAPTPHCVYPIDKAPDAFRLMARARHIGKIVVETEPSAPAPARHAEFRADATYLLTGGLGGLGLKVARWMVERGARALVLSGRSGAASETARSALDDLQALGARVVAVRCDVGRLEDVRDLLAEIDRTMPPLAGVVHLAGVLDDGVLRQQTRERFDRVMAPKATGAWNLHVLTRDRPLDVFVLFSSAASLVGSPGQANYAAANAFLDALAHHRRARGLPALGVNWGNWSQVGMAAALEATEGQRWAAAGMGWIEPELGLATLGRLLASETVLAGVLPVDWPRFFQKIPPGAEPPWLGEMAREARAEAAPSARSDLLQRLDAVTAGERLDVLTGFVREQAAAVLGVDLALAPDLRRPLNELGLDSLMAVELCNALGRALGHHLPPSLLFDYPTLDSLIGHIASDILLIGTEGPDERDDEAAPDDPVRSKVLAEVEGLSEDAMNALVAEELAKLMP